MESTALCRDCRFPLQSGSRFCSQCGLALEGNGVESERRQLTLLFCDMVGSTALSERLDPEDLRDLLTSYQQVCRDAIGGYQGHISQFLGDGVMSYFGYPIAHEDDAVRAIRAALRILEGIEFVNRGIGKRLNAEIHVRMGIHTGVAVVGDIGPGGAHDRLAVGETVNLASRIEAIAGVDTVLVSGSTARLVAGHFELEALSSQTLRGFTRPVELFRVIRPTGARTRFEAAARGTLTPHVGRDRELAELARLWTEVRDGAGRVVVIHGEAGIGKSRIVHQFRLSVIEEGARILEWFCSPLAQAPALSPVIEMLDGRLVERAGGDARPQAKLDALRRMLGAHSRFEADALPLMASLLSIPGADEAPIRELSPVRRRARTLEVMLAWLASSAERLPVALFVEDVHWADPSTLELLDLMVREGPVPRALLCLTGRPEFLVRWTKPEICVLELGRLGPSEVEAMVTHVAGGHPLPPPVVRRIAERSEGVPLFVEEITKAVLESGALRLNGTGYELTGGFDEQLVPSTVRGSLVARFDRLGESRRIAQLGAAIGREFRYPLIRAVAGIGDDELRDHLHRLDRIELTLAHGDLPNVTYTFKHALIQDAIYGTLLKKDRQRVHERIFSKLREEFPEMIDAQPERAAYHAESAGLRDVAVALFQEAGTRAFARTAMAEAVKHLSHAIELVDSLPEPGRTDVEMALQAVVGPAYMATLGWAAPEVERSSARLRDLATARGDSAKLYQAMWGLWTVHFVRGELHAAIEIARQVYAAASAAGNPLYAITGCHALGYTSYYRAELEEARRIAKEGLALSTLERERQIAAIFQISSGAITRGFCSAALWLLGEQDQAAEMVEEWHRLVADLNHAPSTALSWAFEGYVLHMLGDVPGLRNLALRLRTISEQEGFQLWISMSNVFEAWARAHAGEVAAAVEQMNQAIAGWYATSSNLTMCDNTVMQVEVLLLAGRAGDALQAIARGKEICARSGERTLEPELHRLEAEACLALGRRDEAIAACRRAADCARELGALSLELRAAIGLHRILTSAESLEELRRVYAKFTEGFDKPDLRQARLLLAAVTGTANGTASATHPAISDDCAEDRTVEP
jgi:class 3 adenylate cyclase/predicted ATPase